MPTYSLTELAKLADVTPRTIRYYIAQGILPAPDPQGPNTRYTDEHLARLRTIRKLQAAHLPLAEIRERLRAMPAVDVALLSEPPPSAPAGRAIDYIRDVLKRPSAPDQALPMRALPLPGPATPTPASPVKPEEPSRSQWERLSLHPDVELHIRRPLTRLNNKRVERLIAITRQLFEED